MLVNSRFFLLTLWTLGGNDFLEVAGYLNYKFHGEFEEIWNDRGSGANLDGSFWKPKNVPDGYFILGHLSLGAHYFDRSAFTVIVKAESADDLKPPESLTWVYDDYKSGTDMDVTVVQPIPPAGYVCLGMLAYPRRAMPSVQEFPLLRCVRSNLTTEGHIANLLWNDGGSSGRHDFSSWQIVSLDRSVGLSVGAFYGHRSHDLPPRHSHYVLKKQSLGSETDFLTQVTNLMRVHSPNVYFHPSEKYFPDNAETTFNQLTFFYGNIVNNYDNFKREVQGSFQNFGTLTNQQALIQQAHASGFEYWLGVPEDLFPGNLSRAQAYMGAVARPGPEKFVDLVFYIFYPYNGPGRYNAAFGIVHLQGARLQKSGSHQGDWEHFTIRIRKPEFAHDPVLIDNYYVSIHNGGRWVGTKLESDADGRPVLYSALYTHAMYDYAGSHKYCRPKSVNGGIGTFVVDLIDETGRGRVLKTWENLQMIEPNIFAVAQPVPVWFNFTGRWGDYYQISESITTVFGITAYTFTEVSSGPSGPKNKGVWQAAEVTESVQCT